MMIMTERPEPISPMITQLSRNPDWWLQSAADAMRKSVHRLRSGADHDQELTWLADRIEWLIYLAEHSESGGS